MEQIEIVKKRLKKENISIRELSEITNLSEATLYRYFEGTKCSKKTRLIMDEFIEFA
ncbi:helix-turn-helix domain-containing protein [Erysipelothrix sp. D19-032]